ncbi:MAG TPA: hypothetical protein PLX80_01820 [Ignavibacteria bacterium]|nr:hypothetical protein [Ignavibacteria bacterium]
MNTNTELFDLIKSLTSSEKRYFTLNASVQKGNKKYLKLFDLIDSQRSNDEKTLRSLKGKEDITKNFNFTKNYLTKLIFKSLLNYKNEKSTDAKLFNMLQRCRILFDKALFRQYFKTVKAGKQLAEKNERFSFLIEFMEIERQLTKKEELSGVNIEEVFDDELKILNKIRDINNYKKTVSLLFRFYRTKGMVRSEQNEKDLDECMNDLLIVSETVSDGMGMSVTAKERYLFAMSMAEEIKGNFDASYNYSTKRFKLISNNINVFDESLFDSYKDSVLSAVYSASISRKFAKAEKHLDSLKINSGKTEINDLNIMLSELHYNLLRVLNGKVNKNKNTILAETEKFLKRNKNKITINTFNLIVYRLSAIDFFEKNYNECLRIFGEYSLEKNSGLSPFIEPYARMLLILIHFEMKDHKLLQYMIPSAKKYLRSRNALHKTEDTVLNFISKMSKQNKNTNQKTLLSELTNDLIRFKKDKYEKNAFEYFDYLRWIKNINY